MSLSPRARLALVRTVSSLLIAGGVATVVGESVGMSPRELPAGLTAQAEYERALERIHREDAERYLYQEIAARAASYQPSAPGANEAEQMEFETDALGGAPSPGGIEQRTLNNLSIVAGEIASEAFGGAIEDPRPSAAEREANLRAWRIVRPYGSADEHIGGEGPDRGLFDGQTNENNCETCGKLRDEVIEDLVVLTGPPSAERGALTAPIVRDVLTPPSAREGAGSAGRDSEEGLSLAVLLGGVGAAAAGAGVLTRGQRPQQQPLSPAERMRQQLLARRRELANLPDGPVAAEALARVEELLAALEDDEVSERSERSEERASTILDEVVLLGAAHRGHREAHELGSLRISGAVSAEASHPSGAGG